MLHERKKTEKRQHQSMVSQNTQIIQMLEELTLKIDGIDKGNKKFLMAATMGDEKYTVLEQENKKLREGVFGILDQLHILIDMIEIIGNEELKTGLDTYARKNEEILENIGIVEIPTVGTQFDPTLHRCIEKVNRKDVPESQIVAVHKRGYVNSSSGTVFRIAEVTVNGGNN